MSAQAVEEFLQEDRGPDEVLRTRMLVSGIFKQLRTFVVVPDGLSKHSKIGNVIFFR